jgi:hypothetical protein
LRKIWREQIWNSSLNSTNRIKIKNNFKCHFYFRLNILLIDSTQHFEIKRRIASVYIEKTIFFYFWTFDCYQVAI